MNPIQRLGLFMAGGVKSVFDLIPSWIRDKPVYPLANFENNVKHGYRKNELIYACVGIVADSATSAKIRLVKKSNKKEIESHPLLDLIQHPNPVTATTEFDLVWVTLALLWLSGVCYWEKVRARSGAVVQLWPLRPDWVRVVPRKNGLIDYQYEVPGQSPIPIRGEDVLDFKLTDPLNLWAGLSPVSVACRAGDVDNSVTDYLNQFFQHGGNPPGLLSIKTKVTPERRAEIRAQWREVYGGWRAWLEPAVLDADASFTKTGLTATEMGFDSVDLRDEVRICAALRVPPVLVGARIGLERMINNAEQSERYFWRNTLLPQYKRIANELSQDLAREFGDDLKIEWDFSEVAALTEDRSVKWQRSREAFLAGLVKRDEARDEMGLDEIGGEEGDAFYGAEAQVETDGSKTEAPQILGYHIESGTVARNEARAALNLPPENDNLSEKLRLLGIQLSVMEQAVRAGIPPDQAAELVGLGITVEVPEPVDENDPASDEGDTSEATEGGQDAPDSDEDGNDTSDAKTRAFKRIAPPDIRARKAFEDEIEDALIDYFAGQIKRYVEAVS